MNMRMQHARKVAILSAIALTLFGIFRIYRLTDWSPHVVQDRDRIYSVLRKQNFTTLGTRDTLAAHAPLGAPSMTRDNATSNVASSPVNLLPVKIDLESLKLNPSLFPSAVPCTYGRSIEKERWLLTKSNQGGGADLPKRTKVREMMLHAWGGYVKYAWGSNELAPEVGRQLDGPFDGTRFGLTIIDSLDTLWLMGLFEEVQQGKLWLVENLPSRLNKSVEISVFEFNIRVVGGLLSMFALTSECEYRDLALLCGEILTPAFNTPHGIPYSKVDLKRGLPQFHQHSTAVLAELGSLHLEFMYLSYVTGNAKYARLVKITRDAAVKAKNSKGLYSNVMFVDSATFTEPAMVSLGAMGDSFYEYLLKSFIQSSGRDELAKLLFFDAIMSMDNVGMIKMSAEKLKFVASYEHEDLSDRMQHLTCFIGGTLGLSAQFANMPKETLELAEDLTRTCHESYSRSPVGLGPEEFSFVPGAEAKPKFVDRAAYMLRPEVVESYFTLYRITHKEVYRDWAWQVVQALEKHCRLQNGYAGILDINAEHILTDDHQPSFFLAETLKYLYLIFETSDLLPLTEWVFNTEAHPLPILANINGPSV